jgi:hypothetical protein
MGINLGGNILYIKRSSGLVPMYSNSGFNSSSLGILAGGVGGYDSYSGMKESQSSKVICIKNMVTMKELEDEDEYDDLYYDVMEECKNYGKVNTIKIPRPEGAGVMVPGLGKVFVEYMTRDGAAFARDVSYIFNNRIFMVNLSMEGMLRSFSIQKTCLRKTN